MKIQIIKTAIPVGFGKVAGQTADYPTEIAEQLIEDGYAIALKTEDDDIRDTDTNKPTNKPKRRKRASKGNS